MPSVRTISLGYNSLYLVEEAGERLLVDAGPDFDTARELLVQRLEGQSPGLVAITHGHIDHAGLGAYWLNRGVTVAMGAADVHLAAGPALEKSHEWRAMAVYLHASGAPPGIEREMLAGLEQRRQWADRAAHESSYPVAAKGSRWPTGLRYEPFVAEQILSEDECLPVGLRALHCPGHTPGNLVLVHEGEGWLFSGDQLLPTITPTPAIQFDTSAEGAVRFHSLPRFVDSLRRLRAMQFEHCFPGHGAPFADVSEVIDANLDQIEQRSVRVLAALREAGEGSVYEIARLLYPRALHRRFWQIIATVQGQLDLLEAEGVAMQRGHVWTVA